MDSSKSFPHDLNAEKLVLSSCLIGLVDEIIPILHPDDFYDGRHQHIYKAIQSLYHDRQPMDINILVDRLRTQGTLEKIGGAAYVASVLNDIPCSAAHAEAHARIVKTHAVTRAVITTCGRILSAGFDGVYAGENLLDEAQRAINEIPVFSSDTNCQSFSDIALGLSDRIDTSNKQNSSAITTGLVKIDDVMGGLFPGDLGIIAARPGQGKSALMGNIMYGAASAGHPVLIFSLEMTKEQLFDRTISRLAQVNISKFRQSKYITENERARIFDATEKDYDLPIHIDDTPYIGHLELIRGARRYHRKHGIQLLMIDYLQLINISTRGPTTRDLAIGEVTRSLKGLAKELSVPIVILSQLNRAIEQRNDPTPMLSDLRESGNIEQDADWIGFVFGDNETGEDWRWFYLAKCRQGKICKTKLRWVGYTTHFEDD